MFFIIKKEFLMDKEIVNSIRVNKNVSEVYRLWENFENFPRFMSHVKSITKTGDRTSHWVMSGPLDRDIEWNARTTELVENKSIAWQSTDGDITTHGHVSFNEINDNTTEVTVDIRYEPPAGVIGEGIARLFSDPGKMLVEDLANFKKFAENYSPRSPGIV
jgi:uncharacterized membrane protein